MGPTRYRRVLDTLRVNPASRRQQAARLSMEGNVGEAVTRHANARARSSSRRLLRLRACAAVNVIACRGRGPPRLLAYLDVGQRGVSDELFALGHTHASPFARSRHINISSILRYHSIVHIMAQPPPVSIPWLVFGCISGRVPVCLLPEIQD